MEAQSKWEMIQAEFACSHEESEIRKLTMSNGKPQYVRQCLRCGHNMGAVRKDTLGIKILQLASFDEDLRTDWSARRMQRYQDMRGQQDAEWRQRYEAVIESAAWQKKRTKIFERDKGLCQACRLRPADQVHHLTYKHLGQEPLFDLVAVCLVCHTALHDYRNDEEREG